MSINESARRGPRHTELAEELRSDDEAREVWEAAKRAGGDERKEATVEEKKNQEEENKNTIAKFARCYMHAFDTCAWGGDALQGFEEWKKLEVLRSTRVDFMGLRF